MYRDVRLWQGVAGKVDLYLFDQRIKLLESEC